MVAVSAGHEYVGGTRGSGIVSRTVDVLGMSVVHGMRVGGVCEICMCMARASGGEWKFTPTNPVGTGGELDVCLC